eukprot:TRINITY_DN56402_c0_g1_i1.p1 TRINITY_DN56402_c0_g1~~TRINITY_DN56402_c0_g1_i1.p1  ORF type:complete len:280 (+),score=45.41 TRINITY_DN56402_c0_g1_i1:48-887(+)
MGLFQLSSPFLGAALSVIVTSLFVITLWLWKGATKRLRDDDKTIKQRFISTGFVSVLALLMVAAADPKPKSGRQAPPLPRQYFGISGAPYLQDLLYVLLLNSALFFGVICTLISDGDHKGFMDFRKLRHLPTLRTFVVGPITEEIVYRVAPVYFLHFSGTSRWLTISFSALCFSVAHLHHLFEMVIQQRMPMGHALPAVVAQGCFTFIFGVYCAFVYISTGSVLNAIALHAYCNYLGPPNGPAGRPFIAFAYVVGIIAFAVLLAWNLPPYNRFSSIFYS